MQSMESPRAGAAGSNGGLGAPPEGPSLTPILSATRTKGFDGQATPRWRASITDSDGDASAVLREALLLFLPAADVAAVGRSLLLISSVVECLCDEFALITLVWVHREGRTF